jgi:prolyl-tRNA editing enzyme YbaK/EbsC (Cys-tRNA(Pro) deacylase)
MMANQLSSSAQRVQHALAAHGVASEVVELPATTRSAKDAAKAIGCNVEQIVKSLIFRGRQTDHAILVLASGKNMVNLERLAALTGEPVDKPDAEFVKQRTGFAIGGVSPAGLAEPLRSFIDEDLLQHDEIWAAAGTPNAVFRLTPQELKIITGGSIVRIT